MALNIPMPGLPGTGFLEGLNSGSSMFTRMIEPQLQRERQRQLAEQFNQEMALRKAQLARSNANSDLQRALLQQQIEHAKNINDPMYKINQFRRIQSLLSGNPDMNQGGMLHDQMPMNAIGQGMGAFPSERPEEQVSLPTENKEIPQNMTIDSLKKNPLLRGYFRSQFGFDPLSETPEQKRAAEFQQQIDLENLKTENKSREAKNKEIMAVNKDLPTLEKSLKGVDQLIKIAENNPDMFGHGFLPERYAKTTKNKNFGTWQNLISDAIAGLEQKLSARGNIVALKMAAQLKPSHAEQQPVAIGKLESMRSQLIDSINHSRELLGKKPLENKLESQAATKKYNDNDLVIVEGPNGQETMTYAQAKALGAQ